MEQQRRKGQRLSGDERKELIGVLVEEYRAGKSIRDLAVQHSLSIGLSRNLLVESGIPLRSRGGSTRGRRPASGQPTG
ncbi:helix-turn-helix domain-containing protein [Motilibacter aurantiacus]|uniref:helix-turn-helix domain-containing protein n=1 Tax=Motilibacter aurantiacus TaxID=2714955 RepID=UPI00140AA0AC|nr:helix-turn-helix domain-containing protein [Motilibacter aurantiacus]NHC46134.1 transcriptional regulator [Motilibacter aurantiacus]